MRITRSIHTFVQKISRRLLGSLAVLYLPPPPADLRFAYGPTRYHFGDLRLPAGPGPHPVVVVIHGGFWRSMYGLEQTGHLCAALTSTGVATWNVEYRRLGNQGGGWPGTFLDVANGVSYLNILLPRYNLDLERILVMGHAAGGQLALWLAGIQRAPASAALNLPDKLPLRGAIALAGVVNLHQAWQLKLSNRVVQRLMGGSPQQYPERYALASPSELLPMGVPQVLLHGTRDRRVPFEISQRYHAAAQAKGEDVRLVSLPGANHFSLIDPHSAAWPHVLEAVQSLLAKR